MKILNDLAMEYQYLLSAIGALATAFVAYLACRGYKAKIRAELKIERKDYLSDRKGQISWEFIVADITNLDSMPIQIKLNSFKIKNGKREDENLLYPIDYYDSRGFPHPLDDIEFKSHVDHQIEYNNPLKEDIKKYPVLINSGDSKMFYLAEEREYISSFSNMRFFEKILLKIGLFFLCYRPKIVLYNKFFFRIKLNKELRKKIKKVINNK